MITEHYATDVPRDTRIVLPDEHAGKLIKAVTIQGLWNPSPGVERCVIYDTDQGEVRLPTWTRVTVEHGPERARRAEFAQAIINGNYGEASRLAVEIENTDHGENARNSHGG